MNKLAPDVLRWFPIGGLLICLVVLVRQYLLMADLVDAQEELSAQLSDELISLQNRLHVQQELSGRLADEVASLRAQLVELARHVSQLAQATNIEEDVRALSARLSLSLLEPGIYVLAPEDADDERDAEEREYTIYHIMVSVGVGDFEQLIQVGAAGSGYLNWQLYFDYDNDGRVDTDTTSKFMASIPLGESIFSFDPDLSQRVYDRFLESSGQAQYTSLDQLSQESGEAAAQLWAYVESRSEQLATWIQNVPGSPNQQDQ